MRHDSQFEWSTGDGAQKQPSVSVAKEKAEQFLQAMLGESSAQYQQVAAGEIARPRSGYLDLDVPGIAVTYKQMKNGEAVPFSDVVIWVDGAGKVVSYGKVNAAEQATFTRLKEALPELNPDAVLSNKGFHSSGYSFLLTNADKEGNQALARQASKSTSFGRRKREDRSMWRSMRRPGGSWRSRFRVLITTIRFPSKRLSRKRSGSLKNSWTPA